MKRSYQTVGLMRTAVLIAAVVFFLIPASAGAANPNKAYFKSFGADVMSGGWFMSGNQPCDTSTSSSYQDPNYAPAGYTADDRTGGILAYAKQNGSGQSTGGASSQYAAFSLGSIESPSTSETSGVPAPPNYGFYSAGSQAAVGNTQRAALTFSNTSLSSSYWGGKYDGGIRQANCIPDYYSKIPTNPAPPNLNVFTSSTASSSSCTSTSGCTYSVTAGSGTTYSLTNSDVSIPAGSKITIYVNGDVYIANNIRYTLDKESNVPKFALVVKGSIYIDQAVTQLDGLYIAQPAGSGFAAVQSDDGDIWTCHPNNTNPVLYTDTGNCTNKLIVNGAFIAKQVNLMRVNGDIGGASTGEDSLSNAQNSSNIGEVINYTPPMEIGGPFFNPPTPNSPPINSLISLPPVF